MGRKLEVAKCPSWSRSWVLLFTDSISESWGHGSDSTSLSWRAEYKVIPMIVLKSFRWEQCGRWDSHQGWVVSVGCIKVNAINKEITNMCHHMNGASENIYYNIKLFWENWL